MKNTFPWRLTPIAALLGILLLGQARAGIEVRPAVVSLNGPESTVQVVVLATGKDGHIEDITRRARFEVSGVVAVIDRSGLASPVAEGDSVLLVRDGEHEASVPVRVSGLARPVPVSFAGQVVPALSKAGCSSGGCHGKAEGQNGFKLSVFGFDPGADHQAIVAEARGRRLNHGDPRSSLLLLKGTATVAHGGGRKIREDSRQHRLLARWIAEGARPAGAEESAPLRLEVDPPSLRMAAGQSRQLRVEAIMPDGSRRCVTAEAEFESNGPNIAGADARGLVRAGSVPGEAAILVRHMAAVTVCRVTIPGSGSGFSKPPERNFIDTLTWKRLDELGIAPAGEADDAAFMRRAYLDTIGTMPTAAEARAFLADKGALKRERLIDSILARPEYAEYQAMVWADLLRVDRDILKAQGAVAMWRWLRAAFASNMPFDRFAREVVAARGPVSGDGPAGFLRALDKPEMAARSVSQLFLGVRIECAQCHHHPSEKWGQDDYAALAGCFTGIGRKVMPDGSEALVPEAAADAKNPRTGKPVPARPLGGEPLAGDPLLRREEFARWMTGPGNPFFARAAVNRVWARYFGRGLVDPVDDLRVTNPAANEELLGALAARFRESGYDLKALAKIIMASRVYQSATDAGADGRNFQAAVYRPLPAEVLLDAISQATAIPEKFNGLPSGTRAIQLWDNRMPSYFLQVFGRPVRATVCSCERGESPSIAQALHLMNSPEINAKLRSARGIAASLAALPLTAGELADEVYLRCLARFPTSAERDAVSSLIGQGAAGRRDGIEDALWTVLNTREFVCNH
jgi:hypothetical protein